jgi:Mg-chelatase subunit ChlD
MVLLVPVVPAPARAGDRAPRPVVVALDDSGSMRRTDPRRQAIQAVVAFIESAAADEGQRFLIEILRFSDNAVVLVPFTDPADPSARAEMVKHIRSIKPTGRWTDIAAALERAYHDIRTLRESAEHPLGPATVLLVTDGKVDLKGGRDSIARSEDRLSRSILPLLAEIDAPVFSIGFGEASDYQLLAEFEQITGGYYARLESPRQIRDVLGRLHSFATREPPPSPEPPRPTLPDARPDATEPPARPAETAASGRAAVVPPEPAEPGWSPALLSVGLALLCLLVLGAAVLTLIRRRRRPFARLIALDPAVVPRALVIRVGARALRIGKTGECDLVLPDRDGLSRHHATIRKQGWAVFLVDHSTNGTSVNRELLARDVPRRLEHRDSVRFGDVPCLFERVYHHADEFTATQAISLGDLPDPGAAPADGSRDTRGGVGRDAADVTRAEGGTTTLPSEPDETGPLSPEPIDDPTLPRTGPLPVAPLSEGAASDHTRREPVGAGPTGAAARPPGTDGARPDGDGTNGEAERQMTIDFFRTRPASISRPTPPR